MMKAGFAFPLIFLTVLIFAADGFLLPESWLNTVEPIPLETNDVNGETQNDLPEGSHPVSAELSDHSRTDILFEGYPDTNGWYSDQNEYTHTNEWYSNMEDYLPVSHDENMDSFKPIIEWSTGSIEETGDDRPDIQALDAQESQPEKTITPEKSMLDPEESAVIPEKHNAEKNTASLEENATTPGKHNANVEENEATADTHTANAVENEATAETQNVTPEEDTATVDTHTANVEENGATAEESDATADTYTANAEENEATVETHTANGEENGANMYTHTANAVENEANVYTPTANGEENEATMYTHTANGEENGANMYTHTANAEENTATVDTHKANAEENEATMYTHTANGEENEATVETHNATPKESTASAETHKASPEEDTATVDATHKANADENEYTAEAQNVTPEEDTDSLLIITSSPYESSTTSINIIPRPTKIPSHAERTPTSKEIVPPKTIYHMQPINHTPSGTEKQSQKENSPTKAKSSDFNIEVIGKKPVTSKGKTPVRAPNFICLHPGRFRDPFDCKKYYTCRQGKIAKGKVTAYHYECAQNMWFSNYYRKCVKFKPGICRDFSENKMHVMKRGRVK